MIPSSRNTQIFQAISGAPWTWWPCPPYTPQRTLNQVFRSLIVSWYEWEHCGTHWWGCEWMNKWDLVLWGVKCSDPDLSPIWGYKGKSFQPCSTLDLGDRSLVSKRSLDSGLGSSTCQPREKADQVWHPGSKQGTRKRLSDPWVRRGLQVICACFPYTGTPCFKSHMLLPSDSGFGVWIATLVPS